MATSIISSNKDLTSGNLFKKIIIYLIPLFLSNALQLLFTTVDLFTVTHFGDGNISSGAIGATTNLINLVLCVFWGVTGGVSVVAANAKGADDHEKMQKAIGCSTLIMLIAGLFCVVFGSIFARSLLKALDTDEIFIDKSTDYLFIYFLGSLFNIMYTTGACILRAFGDSKRPFVAVVISGIINVLLDLLFVIVFKMDVKGVAIATIASQAIAMVIVYYFLIKDQKLPANFRLKYFRFYKEQGFDILRIGLASGLQGFIFNFTNVFVQKCTNQLGHEVVIGKAAASNVEGYEYALLNSISNTCLVAVSQNFGALNKKRMKESLWICIILELLLVTVFDGVVLLANRPLLSIFIASGEETTEAAFANAYTSLLLLGIPYALCGVPECASGYLRGMKYSIVPTIVSLICIVGLRMVFIWFMFDMEFFHTFTWLMAVYPFSWILCCIAYIPVTIILSKQKFKKLNLN